jgi:hypothetical protein
MVGTERLKENYDLHRLVEQDLGPAPCLADALTCGNDLSTMNTRNSVWQSGQTAMAVAIVISFCLPHYGSIIPVTQGFAYRGHLCR